MELSRYLRYYAKSVKDKTQLIISAFAKALEIIPRQLCSNAGFDATDIVASLRAAHAKGDRWMGVDIENEGVVDTLKVGWPSTCVARPSSTHVLACCADFCVGAGPCAAECVGGRYRGCLHRAVGRRDCS